jgi:hypothetical protein
MAEYILTPDQKEAPSGTFLLEELHRRGFPVEISLKGPDDHWESVRFHEPGPPPVECLLSRDPQGTYRVSIFHDSPLEALELQLYLVEAILQKTGGTADNSSTRERYTVKQLTAKLRNFHRTDRKTKDLFWLGFAWAVVVMGVAASFSLRPPLRSAAFLVLAVAFLSAAGQTYSHFKGE